MQSHQTGKQQTIPHLCKQSLLRKHSLCQIEIGGRSFDRACQPYLKAIACGCHAILFRCPAVIKQGFQHAVFDNGFIFARNALTVEGLCAIAAQKQGIIPQCNPFGCDFFARFALQKREALLRIFRKEYPCKRAQKRNHRPAVENHIVFSAWHRRCPQMGCGTLCRHSARFLRVEIIPILCLPEIGACFGFSAFFCNRRNISRRKIFRKGNIQTSGVADDNLRQRCPQRAVIQRSNLLRTCQCRCFHTHGGVDFFLHP